MNVLIDTNILLDVIQQRQPHYDPALRVWKLVEERKLTGFVSAISFNNIHYIARKQMGYDHALDAVIAVRKTFNFVALDEQILDRAIAAKATDLEDAIQAATAIRAGAEYVVTRDPRDFARLGVPVLNAVELLAIL